MGLCIMLKDLVNIKKKYISKILNCLVMFYLMGLQIETYEGLVRTWKKEENYLPFDKIRSEKNAER